MYLLRALLLIALGMMLGFWLPDRDLSFSWFGLVVHRSILTHGCLLPLLGGWLTRSARPNWRFLLSGLCAALAIHLSFDLFPARWTGFALITIPLLGRTSALVSWLWIAGSILVCLVLLFRWLGSAGELALALMSLAVGFGLSLPRPFSAGLLPLVALISASLLAVGLTACTKPLLRARSTWRLAGLR
jgi:hypothetical protein